jgi:hypothetical protein
MCEISDSHGCNYKEFYFLGCNACIVVEFYVSEELNISIFRVGLARGNLYSEDKVNTLV